MFDKYVWDIITKYFEDNPYSLTKHSIQSFNDFIDIKIPQLIQKNNPIMIFKDALKENEVVKDYQYKIKIYGFIRCPYKI